MARSLRDGSYAEFEFSVLIFLAMLAYAKEQSVGLSWKQACLGVFVLAFIPTLSSGWGKVMRKYFFGAMELFMFYATWELVCSIFFNLSSYEDDCHSRHQFAGPCL